MQQLNVGNKYIQTWNLYKDPGEKVEKITRKFYENCPVTDGGYTVGNPAIVY